MWGAIEIRPEENSQFDFKHVKIFLQRLYDEWRFAYKHRESETADCSPKEEDWIRLVSTTDETLELSPVLPDRPLVIRPESPLSIFPKRYASFFVALPVWYRFTAVSAKGRTNLIDIPSRVLSNTWFGDPSGGELCYSLDAQLRRASTLQEDRETVVTCSLAVRNGSEEKLNFERICAHVENLSVFEDDEGRLWTNEIKVLFKGTEQISQLTIQNRPPTDISTARKIAIPRETTNKNILRRSFVFFRQITGI